MKYLDSSAVGNNSDGLQTAGVGPTRLYPTVHKPFGVFAAVHSKDVLTRAHKAVHGAVKCSDVGVPKHVAHFPLCFLHLQHVHTHYLQGGSYLPPHIHYY